MICLTDALSWAVRSLRHTAIATVGFGRVQRLVGSFINRLGRVSGPKLGDAAGHGDRNGRAPEMKAHRGDLLAQAVGKGLGSLDGSSGEQNHELFATNAGHKVLDPRGIGQHTGDHRQQTVAGLVAKVIVDLLEKIEIPDRIAQRQAVTLPALKLFLQAPIVGDRVWAPVRASCMSRSS